MDSDSMGDFYNKNGFGRQASFPLTFFCSWVINIGTSGIFERNFELFSAAVLQDTFWLWLWQFPSALVIGWKKRLYKAVNPLTKVLGPIPP